MTASVPDEVKRSRSMDGIRARIALRQLDLQRAGRAEGEPVQRRVPDRVDDGRMPVTKDGRSPAADVVEILAAVRRRARARPNPRPG
ncbi:MAG: hypothetical protein WKF78_12485 [Candidatus Limnocylindrales bacterium]